MWLEEKEKDRAKATRLCRERAEAKGKSWQWSYAYEETLRFLKARSPYLSFSGSDADLELADKLVTLFEGVT